MSAPTLIERLEAASMGDNALDVLVEVALFEPDEIYASVRANAAGTKVVYTRQDGRQETCWAMDYCSRKNRSEALKALRAQTPGGK